MGGVVKKHIRRYRSKQLRILSEKLQRSFNQKHLNTTRTALFEQEDKEGYLSGFTDNYIKIKIPFTTEICRTKQQVKLMEINEDGIMKAELL